MRDGSSHLEDNQRAGEAELDFTSSIKDDFRAGVNASNVDLSPDTKQLLVEVVADEGLDSLEGILNKILDSQASATSLDAELADIVDRCRTGKSKFGGVISYDEGRAAARKELVQEFKTTINSLGVTLEALKHGLRLDSADPTIGKQAGSKHTEAAMRTGLESISLNLSRFGSLGAVLLDEFQAIYEPATVQNFRSAVDFLTVTFGGMASVVEAVDLVEEDDEYENI